MFKEFILKKLMASKLKDVPEAERAKIMKLMETNPELLMKIATEAQEKMKTGMSQMDAMMLVAKNHEAELKEALK